MGRLLPTTFSPAPYPLCSALLVFFYVLGINDQEAGRGIELIRQASSGRPIVQLHWRGKGLS
jgi:hypothetical protein